MTIVGCLSHIKKIRMTHNYIKRKVIILSQFHFLYLGKLPFSYLANQLFGLFLLSHIFFQQSYVPLSDILLLKFRAVPI